MGGQVNYNALTSPIQIGNKTSGNYAETREDGTIRLVGDATCWDDIQGGLFGKRITGTAGKIDTDWDENTIKLQPSGVITSAADRGAWNIQMYHAAEADAPLEVHIHWEQTDATQRDITIQYRVQSNGDAKTTAWTQTTVNIADAANSAFPYVSGTLNQISELLSVPLIGMGLSTIIQFQFARTDSNLGDIYVTYVDCHYRKDSFGSSEEYVK